MKRIAAIVGVVLGLVASTASASVFEGRNASNQVDLLCTSSGVTKCTSYYDSALGITILNNWKIGQGLFDLFQAPGSAQAIAATAGQNATGLSGWVLPTGDPNHQGSNQYLSIWNSAGATYAKLSLQFDNVVSDDYWSSSGILFFDAWVFYTDLGLSFQGFSNKKMAFAVAVLDCDVANSVCQARHEVPTPPPTPTPTPATIALLGLGLVGIGATRRRRA